MDIQTSETIDLLATALCEAQGEFEDAKKEANNPHFHRTYADFASVKDACQPALTKYGLAVVQFPGGDGQKIWVTTRVLHKSGQWMQGTLVLTPVKGDPQAAGSAITYARRYSLMAVLGIAPVDDDANQASGRSDVPSFSAPPTPPPRLERVVTVTATSLISEIAQLMEIHSISTEEVQKLTGINSLREARDKEQVSALQEGLNKLREHVKGLQKAG